MDYVEHQRGHLLHGVSLPDIPPHRTCSAALQDLWLPHAAPARATVPVPQPGGYDVARPLALAMSPDGKYIAFAGSHSVSLIGLGGEHVAALPLKTAPTGLCFSASGHDLVVMTETAIYLWTPFSGQRPLVLPQSSAPIDAELNASADRLASANARMRPASVPDTTRLTRKRAISGCEVTSTK